MRAGDLAAASLGLSGVAMALAPRRTASSLGLSVESARGAAELRAGLGGTMAGLGLWAWARGSRDSYAAVGMTCLGAAAFRTAAFRELDLSGRALLVGEVAMGAAGVLARPRSTS